MDNPIIGVGLLLFTRISGIYKLFTIKELKGKPAICKKVGMISFPLETFEARDINPAGTLNRLIREEIGIPSSQVEVEGVSTEKFQLIPGRSDVITMYGVGLFKGNVHQVFMPRDNDIIFYGWKTVEELLSCQSIRVEVAPIIKHYKQNWPA